ncbi:HNH endonuclease [Pseudovibrio sp. WM33]|uniref:HNH endonuclease n=1 Tax=Pseudovibrio sp. WM33 TaxID=1735585 RepID=UPI0007AEBCEE|nr:HNH endonuclease [Pseudovibrio sp. WM33]KZL21912.1 hypothetical protein PsWM33_04149 [Pseudovibrio sp. WM33]
MAKAPSSAARNAGQAGLIAGRKAGGEAARLNGMTNIKKNGKAPDVIDSSTAAAKRVPPSGPKGLNKGEKTDLSANEWEAQRPKGTPTKNNKNFVKAEKYADGSYKVHMKHSSGDTYSVPFDKDGNPDFYSVRNETKNGELVEAVYRDSEVELTKLAHPNDYANKYDLSTANGRKKAKDAARDVDKRAAEGAFQKTPFYHWHHNGGTSMIAVDEEVHRLFKHYGEFSRNSKT